MQQNLKRHFPSAELLLVQVLNNQLRVSANQYPNLQKSQLECLVQLWPQSVHVYVFEYSLFNISNFDHMLYKNSRRYDDLWIKLSQFHILMHLCNGGFCCFGHDRTKIPCCLTVGQVAPLICLIGIHKGIICMNRIFQPMVLSIILSCSFSHSELSNKPRMTKNTP